MVINVLTSQLTIRKTAAAAAMSASYMRSRMQLLPHVLRAHASTNVRRALSISVKAIPQMSLFVLIQRQITIIAVLNPHQNLERRVWTAPFVSKVSAN